MLATSVMNFESTPGKVLQWSQSLRSLKLPSASAPNIRKLKRQMIGKMTSSPDFQLKRLAGESIGTKLKAPATPIRELQAGHSAYRLWSCQWQVALRTTYVIGLARIGYAL
jgi:hypothetical protein